MNQGTVLVVEDDPALREVICETLQLAKYAVDTAENGQEALQLLDVNKDITLLLSDVQMQPVDGYALLKSVKARYPQIPVILMTAYGTIEKAVQAMHDGANDYLVKPFEAETLVDMVARFIVPSSHHVDGLIAVDPRSQQMAEVARRVAATDATVMISGESGVGKEVVSRFIHDHSNRSAGPFVAINCAAIPENMLESVLFGYEKGAFTGAYQAKAGKFEQAQGGTLLLDEVTEMDLSLQAKLLRVLQEREVERLGGRHLIPLDVRILATTNRDIRQVVAEGSFREDLFYRLNVFPLNILPLRERADDILPIAKKLMMSYIDDGSVVSFSHSAMDVLREHSWPGNVRELDNVVQRAMILRTGNIVDACDIRFEELAPRAHTGRGGVVAELATNDRPVDDSLSSDLKAREADIIISALRDKRSRKEVAEKLGISPRTLRYKLAKLRDAGVALPV
ncbi:MAG: sigma-54 dependent transcriptional regulator [Gammaproteobacteria bacterium]|jgi:two-component system response regulator FlrC